MKKSTKGLFLTPLFIKNVLKSIIKSHSRWIINFKVTELISQYTNQGLYYIDLIEIRNL